MNNLKWIKLEKFEVRSTANKFRKNLMHSEETELIAIIYKHKANIRRTIYLTLDGSLISKEPPKELFSMLPGLGEYMEIIIQKARHCMISNKQNVAITSYTRGSQSFAFGHFIVDILPILFYRS